LFYLERRDGMGRNREERVERIGRHSDETDCERGKLFAKKKTFFKIERNFRRRKGKPENGPGPGRTSIGKKEKKRE
jgi:hypothetical protein